VVDGRATVEMSLQFDREFANEKHAAERSKDGQAILVDIKLTLSAKGQLDVDYTLNGHNASDRLLEVGLALKLPASATRLTWLGTGPYPTYPMQPASGERGVWSVAPQVGFDPSNRMYPGNRTDVALAAATDVAGNGLGVVGQDSTVSVEPADGATWFSDLLRVAGHGQKRNASLQTVKADGLKNVTGHLRVVPLVAGQWPGVFQEVLGSSANVAAR
jgi:hypothetical protein